MLLLLLFIIYHRCLDFYVFFTVVRKTKKSILKVFKLTLNFVADYLILSADYETLSFKNLNSIIIIIESIISRLFFNHIQHKFFVFFNLFHHQSLDLQILQIQKY